MEENQEFFEKLKKGDIESFKYIVNKYKDNVFNTVYSMLGDRHSADDITQEVFLKVYYSLKNFNFKSSISTWIYRIAVNKTIDEIRRRKRIKTVSIDAQTNDDENNKMENFIKSPETEILDNLEKDTKKKLLFNIIDKLPEHYRTVLILKDVECLSYNEIAKIMKISENKVSVWLFRARLKIKEIIQKENLKNELQ